MTDSRNRTGASAQDGVNASTNSLLRELRDITRTLPKGLDEIALGQSVLNDLATYAAFNTAIIFSHLDDGTLAPLAHHGDEASDAFAADPAFERARHANEITVLPDSHNGGYQAVCPLISDTQCVGVIWLTRAVGTWDADELEGIRTVGQSAALQIDSARIFSEVRAIATVEERQRLSREIHDGIAQEIASLGYAVDELTARAADDVQRAGLVDLRSELSRIVSELRLSIFDLRSDIGVEAGLGAALSSYVRQVGTTSTLTIHLVLDESARRLRQSIEIELLRITQEAITNVRRHAQAKNLWVTCRVDPPHAFLRIADDGQGLGSPRSDSYGLEIMRERAQRVGVSLTVRDRRGGGTVVDVATVPGGTPPNTESMKGSDAAPTMRRAAPGGEDSDGD